MKELPLVSVVITSYNQKDVLRRAIDSVVNQTYRNLQIVITDDASTDGSQDLIHRYSKYFPDRIKSIFSISNQGVSKNKNKGFRASDGDFITYLDGDDYYFIEKIERELKVFNSNPSLDVVYSNFAFANEEGIIERYWKQDNCGLPQGYIFENVFSRNFPGWTLYRNELIKAEVLKNIGYYDESLCAFEDWDSRIRMTKSAKVGYSDYVGSAYVNDPRGISRIDKQEHILETMRYVIRKNLHLLDTLPVYRKLRILRRLEISITRQEIDCRSRLFKLPLIAKYLIIGGRINSLVKLTKA